MPRLTLSNGLFRFASRVKLNEQLVRITKLRPSANLEVPPLEDENLNLEALLWTSLLAFWTQADSSVTSVLPNRRV